MAQQTINLGRVACNPMGIYNAATTYNRLDMVMYGGTGYICCANNVTNVTPSADDTKWKPIVDASQISEFTVEELIMTNGQTIIADITTDANGMIVNVDSFTVTDGYNTVNIGGDTVTVSNGNDVNTIKSNSVKVEDIDNEFTEITSTQVNTPEVFTKKVAFSNSQIEEIDDGEHLILQLFADVIDINAETALSISEVNTPKLIANSTQSLIDINSYNPDSQIILHKNGKTVQLKDGLLNADEAYVQELNMNADGDMGGVIAFGDKNGSENIIEISEREDDQLTIQAPNILCTGPSYGQGLPNIQFKQKTGTNTYGLPSLKLEWDGTTLPRPNIKTRFGLSMNSDGIDYGLYLNYGNVWSGLNDFKFKSIELPYTWRDSTITPTFKVGNYQIKHINGQYGDVEIGEENSWTNVYDYNNNFFFNGLALMNKYYYEEGDYDMQNYMYFNTFDGDEGEMSGVINAEFGLNYSGKELNIWDWDEYAKMTLKTVHDDNTDTTEHIISAPNKLTISSEDDTSIIADGVLTLEGHSGVNINNTVTINADFNVASADEVNIATGELNASVDSMTVDSDNDIELTTNGARVVVGGQLVIASGNTLKIGNTTITEAQLQALLNLL